MGVIDIILGVFLIYGLFKGLKNGLLVEVAGILALIAGIFGAIHFSYIVSEYLETNLNWNEQYTNLAAFIATFIIIVAAIHIAGKFLTKIANIAMLGLLNKLAGAIFGGLKIAIILGAVVVFFDRINNTAKFVSEEKIQSSILYTPIKDIGALVFSKVLKNNTADTTIKNES